MRFAILTCGPVAEQSQVRPGEVRCVGFRQAITSLPSQTVAELIGVYIVRVLKDAKQCGWRASTPSGARSLLAGG
jgi:hypothetical protein